MAKTVLEIRGSMSNIEVDTELIFPNVQTCLAVVGLCGTQLVGVHVTLGDRGRLGVVAAELQKRFGNPSDIYVVGPIHSGGYNVSSFANFGGAAHICDMAGHIDVRAQLNAGTVTFESRPRAGGAWTAIPASNFIS
jgi:hypothetical protein